MVYPRNNFATDAKYWGREVEKKITNLESSLQSSDINNTTRDSQLSVTSNQALIAANDAKDAAQSTADIINNIYSAGTTEINGGVIKSGTITANEISANYVYAGTIEANKIIAGTLTGFTIRTAASGQRAELSGTDIKFYNSSQGTGNISGGTHAGYPSLTLSSGSNGVVFLESTQGTYITGGLSVQGGALMNNGLNVIGATNTGTVLATGEITTTSGNISASNGTVTASNFSGTTNTSIAGNTTGSFGGNVFINTSGNMFRSTQTSSRDAKENISPIQFDTDAFISVNPVEFNYKAEAVSTAEEAALPQLGFILEDFEDAGVSEHLVIPTNELDDYKGLRYDKLYMYLHKVVQTQNETIKTLEARLDALEAE
jgi:hypothetical protein